MKKHVKASGLKSLCLTVLMVFGLAACGTTLEKQQNRYKKNTDTIEAVVAKKPKMATAIKAKLASFNAEKDTIIKAGGEDAKTKLARLNSRMEAYAVKLDPSLAPASKGKKATPAKGKKATTAKGKAPASKAPGTTSKLAPKSAASAAPATTGKLGAPATTAPATTGKLGAAPATTGKLGAPKAPATTGKLGAPTTGKLGAPKAPATTGKLGAP